MIFKRNRPDLFTTPVFSDQDHLYMQIISGNGDTTNTIATYIKDSSKIEYPMPQNLANEKIYQLRLVKKNNTTGQISEFYKYYFRTSQFNTFHDKFNTLFTTNVAMWTFPLRGNVEDWIGSFSVPAGDEQMDYYESKIGTIIHFDFVTKNNAWFNSHYLASLYALVDSGKFTLHRSKEPYGIPPVNDSYFNTDTFFNHVILNMSQITNNEAPRNIEDGYLSINFVGTKIMDDDWYDMRNQISNYVEPDKRTAIENAILSETFYLPSPGDYYFNMYYQIPGTDIITFNTQVCFNYVINK